MFKQLQKIFNTSSSAASSSNAAVLSVQSKSWGDPLFDHANFFIGSETPQRLAKDSFIVILKDNFPSKLHYKTSLYSTDIIEIKSPNSFLEYVNLLRQKGDIQSLSATEIKELIASTGTEYTPQNEVVLVTGFETKVYAPDTPVLYEDNQALYFKQMEQLVLFMNTQLIPLYYNMTDYQLAANNLEQFLRKIQDENFIQTAAIFDQSKRLLAALCLTFSLDKEKKYSSNFKYLCAQLGNCGPGTLTSIVETYLEIKSENNQDVPGWMASLRESVFNQVIWLHAREQDLPAGMQLHLPAWFRPVAQQLGFNLSPESEVIGQLNDMYRANNGLRINSHTNEWLLRNFTDRFNRTAIISMMTEKFFNEIMDCSRSDPQQLIHKVEENRLAISALFKMKKQALTFLQMLTYPEQTIRGDFIRNLRRYVERYLVEEDYIGALRPTKLSFNLDIKGKILSLVYRKKNGTNIEYDALIEQTILQLKKIPGLMIKQRASTLEISSHRAAMPYYCILLSLSDIQNEYEISEPTLETVLNKLKKDKHLAAVEADFLSNRFRSSSMFTSPVPAPSATGFNPVYCFDTETEAL